MTLLSTFVRMTRYRAAVNLSIFMLCGAAFHPNANGLGLRLLLAAVALTATYAVATSINDIADHAIDRINLAGHAERPLVAGTASTGRLCLIALAAAGLAIGAGYLAGPVTGALLIFEVALAAQYSLPPLRASRRARLAPLYMPIPCVVVPYAIGVYVSGGGWNPGDALVLPALFVLFVARILLKDFRDADGDSTFGKQTILLRYGKQATCVLSACALGGSGALLIIALRGTPLLALGVIPFLAGILALQWRLSRVSRLVDEVITIGVAARIGNGMLLTLLASRLLQQAGAGGAPQAALYVMALATYGHLLRSYLLSPGDFRFGSDAVHAAIVKRGLGSEETHQAA